MHTTTSKQILTPLAEAVFQLILIISEAEINQSAIPDLTQLAKIVDTQIVNLVSVGTKIQNQQAADEYLKIEMPKACDEVSKASFRLITGTTELSKNPYSKSGKNDLLESAKGILSGTSNVLYAFDNFEIRKIINIARLCSSKVESIENEISMQPQQLVQLLMQSSQIVVQLAQLANKRVSELLSPKLQQRLKTAVEDLTRESPHLISSSKAFLLSANNSYIKNARNQSCRRLASICMEIEIVVQLESDEDLEAHSYTDDVLEALLRKNHNTGLQLLEFIRNEDVDNARETLELLLSENKNLKQHIRDYIAQCTNPNLKKTLEDLLERIEEEELEMVKLGNQLFLDPSNVILQDQLASILDSMNQIWKDIAIQKNDKSWQNLTQANRENGQAIVAAFKVPDTEDALLKNLAYQATTKTLKQRALEMMEKSDDLSTRKNIQGHLIAIGTDLDKVQNLISSLAKDPKNAQNIKDLSTNLDNIDDKWSQLGESNLKTKQQAFEDLKSRSKSTADAAISSFKKSDVKKANLLLDRYNNISQDLSSKAKEFAAEVGDSDQKKILEAIKENTQLQLNINEIAKDLTIDPTNQANLKSISKAIDSCDQNWGLIAASRFKNDPIFDKMIESFVAISAKIILDIKMENIDDAKKGHDSWLNENDKLKKRALEYFAKTDIPSNRIKISSLLNTIEEQKSAVEENLTSLYDNPADGNTLNDLSNTFKSISKNYAQIAGQNAQDGKSLQLIQREIDEAAKKIVESIKNKDAPCTRVAGIDYNSLATQFKHNAQLISSQTSAINQEAFNEKMSTLEKVQDDITSQVTDSIQNMKSGSEVSQKEKNRFNRDISYAAALRVAIQVDLSKSLVGLTLSTTNELSDHLKQETAFGNLFASATNGKSTPSSLEAPIKRFKTSSKKLSDILNIAIGFKEHDQKVVQSLSECLQRLQKLEPSIVTSLQALSVNPKDVGANEVTTGLITIWEELIKQTTDCLIGSNGVFNAVEIIDAKHILSQFELLEEAIKNKDVVAVAQLMRNILASTAQFIAIANRECENTSDEQYKQILESKINDIQNIVPVLISCSSTMIISFKSNGLWPEEEVQVLLKNVKELFVILENLGQTIKSHHGVQDVPIAPPPLTAIEENIPKEVIPEPIFEKEMAEIPVEIHDTVEVVLEEAPQLLSEAEAKANPILAVAQELKVEASRWTASDNPIISSANSIAEALENLSKYHKQLRFTPTPDAKKGFINSAKEIVMHTLALTAPAREIANACTDKRLKYQLLATLDRIDTLAQQLKILAAVKAASPKDTDKDFQLILCATNLMLSIKSCLKDCDTITTTRLLKTRRDSNNGASTKKSGLEAMTFRRKVYKGVAVPGS